MWIFGGDERGAPQEQFGCLEIAVTVELMAFRVSLRIALVQTKNSSHMYSVRWGVTHMFWYLESRFLLCSESGVKDDCEAPRWVPFTKEGVLPYALYSRDQTPNILFNYPKSYLQPQTTDRASPLFSSSVCLRE